MEMNPKLPDYVVATDIYGAKPAMLCQEASPIRFPLSTEDQEMLKLLEEKFDQEENCAGLAANQIGFSKKAIIFTVPDDDTLKKWRPDLIDTMPKTIWLNPTYEPEGNDMSTDIEACFSVAGLVGPVERYTTIRYHAFLPNGSEVTGKASGFLARVIQHEVDHLKGILFIDKVSKEKLLPIDEYRKRRAAEIAESAVKK
jgi:peptide deformylase